MASKQKKKHNKHLADLQMKYYNGTLNTTKSKDILLPKDFLLNVWLEHKKELYKAIYISKYKMRSVLCNLAFLVVI